jgi:hypothetical protein
MTPTRRWIVLAAAVSSLAAAPAANAQIGIPSVPAVGALPIPETPTLPPVPLVDTPLAEAAGTVAELQEQVDELLGTGQLPADPAALTDAVQALNDLIAAAPAGTDTSALTSTLATLTESVNSLLGPSSSGAPAVKPAPGVAAAIKAGSLASSPAAAGSKLALPGRITIVTKKLVVSKAGKAKLRVLCPITAIGCIGSLRTYSKLGRMKVIGATVKVLRSGQGRTLTLRFGAKERRRLRKDKKVRILVLSSYAARGVRSLKVTVRKR